MLPSQSSARRGTWDKPDRDEMRLECARRVSREGNAERGRFGRALWETSRVRREGRESGARGDREVRELKDRLRERRDVKDGRFKPEREDSVEEERSRCRIREGAEGGSEEGSRSREVMREELVEEEKG